MSRNQRRRLPRGLLPLLSYTLVAVGLSSCFVAPPRPGSVTADARLVTLPADWPALSGEVEILWDPALVPAIHAEAPSDVPYAIGLVHAHLRLAQMEIFRLVARGRISSAVGPLTIGIDEAIRAIHLDRAVPEIAAGLPPETRTWLERYVAGINDHRSRVPRTMADLRSLGLEDAPPWTVEDVLAIGRLLSVDINWGRFLTLPPLRGERGAEDFFARYEARAAAGAASFGPEVPTPLDPLLRTGRTGSNALVVAGSRSATGGALLASDPHLGLPQPNMWCALSYHTADEDVGGLTVAGLPFVLVGRNRDIGWTGTNMQGISTMLVRADDELLADAATRTERIEARWWPDATRQIRETPLGPVVTDASLLGRLGDGDVVMRWRGHEPSDEATAFLRISRARDWTAFRAAFETYAVAGQNMLYADRDGNIGQVLAIEANLGAARAVHVGIVDIDRASEWEQRIPPTDLPAAHNPPSGFLVSANNTPVRTDPALVPQGNANDRVLRMSELLAGLPSATRDDLAAIQLDVYSGSAHEAARTLAEHAANLELSPGAAALCAQLASWDGRYAADSRGVVAYEHVVDALIDGAYRERYGPGIRGLLRSAPYVHDFVAEDVAGERITAAQLAEAFELAARGDDPDVTWGEVHRIRLAHPLGMVPILGRRYVFGDIPSPGGTTTVHKAAHAIGTGRRTVGFGANARFVSDLQDLDANGLVLLGGQDGVLGSEHLLDQVPAWQAGELLPFPLSRAAQEARAAARSTLRPSPDAAP